MVSSFARTHKSIHKPDKPYYNQVEDQLLLSEGKLIKQIKCKASYPPSVVTQKEGNLREFPMTTNSLVTVVYQR